MKCNPKRTINKLYSQQYEEKYKQEQDYYNSLSDEEKIIFNENKRKRQEEAVRLFCSLGKIANKLGVHKFY